MVPRQLPSVLLEGGASSEASYRCAVGFAEPMPVARTETVPGAGHMVPITHADTVGPMVSEFLA